MENWRPVVGYESLYSVSDKGNVKSLPKSVTYSDGRIRKYGEKILRLQISKSGYAVINLTKDGYKRTKYVHRLVAETFIPNPEQLPEVNHIDEDKTNNCSSNLEWCDRAYNNHHSMITETLNEAKKVSVIQLTLDGTFIRRWDGVREAARGLGMKTHKHIRECCLGQAKSCYGFKWQYE